MINHRLVLDYKLSAGWLEPWVEGIARGTALGRRCDGCGRVSFVPLRHCNCGENNGSWIELPGTATIDVCTDGADGAFALVSFDGADTQTVARLKGFDGDQRRGAIVQPGDDLPAVVLRPFSDEASD